jgi:hypothetical protein
MDGVAIPASTAATSTRRQLSLRALEFRVRGEGLEFRVEDSGFRVKSSEFRDQGSGFRVQSSEFRGCDLKV